MEGRRAVGEGALHWSLPGNRCAGGSKVSTKGVLPRRLPQMVCRGGVLARGYGRHGRGAAAVEGALPSVIAVGGSAGALKRETGGV